MRYINSGCQELGMVLVSLLIFTFIITLLVLASMHTALLVTKQSQNNLSQQVTLQAADTGLQQAEQALRHAQAGNCMYKQTMLVDAMKNKESWWHNQCLGSFPGVHVNYLIGQYNVNQCQHINNKGLRVVILYSIISWAKSETSNVPVILQTVFAKVTDTICVSPSLTHLSIGRLSWRQLK